MTPESLQVIVLRGLALGLVVLILGAWWLPRGERHRLRVSAVLLILGALFAFAWQVSLRTGHSLLPLLYWSLFFLFCGLSRTGYLLVFSTGTRRGVLRLVPRILLDVCEGVTYFVALLFTLRSSGIETSSLVASSAIITAAIGFFLKDTLGNIFAGLAIQLERPFVVGDWIQFDADKSHIGAVIEINWRATRVLTLDQTVIAVPNSALAQALLVVYTQPTTVSRRSVMVMAPLNVPPQQVHGIILNAIADVTTIVDEPPPSVVTNDITEYGVQYWVRFFTHEFAIRDRVDGEVRDRIWYALQRNGIEIPSHRLQVNVERIDDRSGEEIAQHRFSARRRALQEVDFLASLPDEAMDRLARHAKRKWFARGEALIREGESTTQLFLLVAGRVSVSKQSASGESVEIEQLKAHAFFGEMSLLTGAARSATVTAIESCKCYVLDKHDVSPILVGAPALAAKISETIANRAAHQAQAMAKARALEKPEEAPDDLLERIVNFFGL